MKTVPQEDTPAAKEPSSVGGFVLWFFIRLVLYVLSAGPVVKLMAQGQISESTVEKIYAPIEWLENTALGNSLIKPFFRWYGDLWGWK